MNGVESVEEVLKFSELSASFFVVKKKDDKAGKRHSLGAERADGKVSADEI